MDFEQQEFSKTIYSIFNFGFHYPNSKQAIQLNGSITINRGDCVLLTGISGCGKSTLLLALKGIVPHLINGTATGEILFHAQNIQELDDITLQKVGYLQQNPDSQFITNTVFTELAFGLENHGLDPETIKKRIIEIMSQFNLEHLLSRDVDTLSGGEKQKLNLLAILLTQPEVLLLDEPTAFLDPEAAKEVINVITQYAKNKSVILVEHNTHYVSKLVNRVIAIESDGEIKEHDVNQYCWQHKLPEQQSKSINLECNGYPRFDITALKFTYGNRHNLIHQPHNNVSITPDESEDALYIDDTSQTNNLLADINLSLYPNEIIGIVGKNGSGKSTLLKLIAKIIKVKNMMYYDGVDIATLKKNSYWKKVTLLWQNPENHFLYNTVAEELKDVNALISQIGLNELKSHNPFNLSEGQKRRLSLAIALNHNASVFLLDEPTFGQDTENKIKLAKLISNMAQSGKSFICVSHDLAFLNSITNKIYVLKNGCLNLL